MLSCGHHKEPHAEERNLPEQPPLTTETEGTCRDLFPWHSTEFCWPEGRASMVRASKEPLNKRWGVC